MSTLSRATTYGGTALPVAAIYGGVSGEAPMGAAVAVALVGVLLLGARLYLGGLRLPTPDVSLGDARRPSGRTVVSAVLVVALITTATGVASAATLGFQDCSFSDSITGALIMGVIAPNDDGTCRFNPYDDSNVGVADALAAGQTAQAQQDTFVSTVQNFQIDRTEAEWSAGKIAVVNALNNNSSKAEAQEAFNTTVAQRYNATIKNIASHFSAQISQAEYYYSANSSWVSAKSGYGKTLVGWATVNKAVEIGGQTVNVSYRAPLLQGTSLVAGSPFPTADGNASDSTPWTVTNVSSSTVSNASEVQSITQSAQTQIQYVGPNETVPIVNGDGADRPLENLIESARTSVTQIQSNGAALVDSTYANYQSGEINASDILNPTDLAGRAASSYNSTGYYAYAGITLASLGFAGDVNTSMRVTWTHNGTADVYDGQLFYTGDALTLSRNTTYNVTSYNGSFIMAVAANESVNISSHVAYMDSGNITVESLTNPKTGESLSNVSMEKYVHETANVSNLTAELQALANLREQLQQTTTPNSGIGLSLGGGNGLALVIIAGVAIYALGRKDGN